MAPCEINDGKAAETESERTGEKVALIVWTPMRYGASHAADCVRVHRLVPVEVKLAADAAHKSEDGGRRAESGAE